MSDRVARLLVWAVVTVPSWAVVYKYSGLSGVAVYSVATALAVRTVPAMIGRLPLRRVPMLSVMTALAMVLVFALVYPRVNTEAFGSDDDNAHDVGVAALLAGESPYDRRTYLGNQLHQLPGSYVLAAPFAIAGGSAVQGLFWLPLFLVVMSARVVNARTPLAVAWLAGCSAAVTHEVVVGSSYSSNAISVLLAMTAVVRFPRWWVAGAIACGVTMCSRANFPLLAVPLCVLVWREHGGARAMGVAVLVAATLAALTVPFDPLRQEFPPFSGGLARLTALDAFPPAVGMVLLAITLLATPLLSWRVDDESMLWLVSGAILAVPIVLGAAFGTTVHWRAAHGFLPYGTFVMWFVLAGLGPRIDAWVS
jgi:hypothetical protein